jgi:hypothetical protein
MNCMNLCCIRHKVYYFCSLVARWLLVDVGTAELSFD